MKNIPFNMFEWVLNGFQNMKLESNQVFPAAVFDPQKLSWFFLSFN